MKKVKLTDIAREARVGTATVERVLNSRGNVRPEMVERVVVAARKLGYDRRLPQRYHGIIRIEVIMMRPDTPFFARLNKAFARIAATLDSSIMIHRTFLDELDPLSVARHIASPGFRRSGLIIVAPDHPAVEACLRDVKSAGVPVVHIVSRIGDEDDSFVGIDNYAAGRTAAYYMSNMLRPRSGSLVALCHSGVYEVHRERVRGFSHYLAEHPDPGHIFALVMFGRDDRLRSAEVLRDALKTYPDIIGIYNAGGANSGIASVLEDHCAGGSAAPVGSKAIMWIGHELTDNTRRWLKCGLMNIVLDQGPEIQARRAIDTVLRRIGFLDVEVTTEPVRFLTISAENL
jgi:LacI family transcriptional regulator, galactose operon repressor